MTPPTPALPKPAGFGSTGEDLFTAAQLQAHAAAEVAKAEQHAVARFLESSGQYVTNDASREAAIAAAVEALKDDAERYRWLRDNGQAVSVWLDDDGPHWSISTRFNNVVAAELDGAIDSARRVG